MILSKNTRAVFCSFTILTFCFMIFGCDYVKKEQKEESSLKGEKITAEYFKKHAPKIKNSNCCSNKGNPSIEVYSVNVNSPKAKELKNRIISDLKSFSTQENSSEISSVNDPAEIPDPDMVNSVILENTETGQERIVTPLDNGIDTIKEYNFAEYNSATNTITSKLFYYQAETTYSKSQLEANPSLADQTTADIEIKDENGQIIFSKAYTSSSTTSKASDGHTTNGCFGDCINEIRAGMDWFTWLLCMVAGPLCALGFTIYCTAYCL